MGPFENTHNHSSLENTNPQCEERIRKLHQKDNILKRLALKRQEETNYQYLSVRDKQIILLNSRYAKLITNNLPVESLLTKEEIEEALTPPTKDKEERITAPKQEQTQFTADRIYSDAQMQELTSNIIKEITIQRLPERLVPVSPLTSAVLRISRLWQTPVENPITYLNDESASYKVDKKTPTHLSEKAKNDLRNLLTNNDNPSKVTTLKAFDKALKHNSKDPEHYNKIGNNLLALGEYQKAIIAFNEALKHDYENPAFPYCNIGICLSSLGIESTLLGQENRAVNFYEQALIFFNKSISTNSEIPETYDNKASTLNELKRNQEALKTEDEAIKRNPNNAGFYYNKGNIYADLGWYEEALTNYNAAIEINPSKGNYHFNQGCALNNLEWYENAQVAFEEAQKHGYEDPDLYFGKGIAHYHLGQYKKALAAFEEAQKHGYEDPDLYFNMGIAHKRLGQYKKALAAFEEAQKHGDESPNLYFNMGVSFAHLDQYKKALAAFEEAQKHGDESPNLYFNMGIAHKRLDQYKKALTAFEEAQKHGCENPGLHFGKGIALKGLNRYKEALTAFKEAQKHGYESPDLDDHRKQIENIHKTIPQSSTREIPHIRKVVENKTADLATTIQEHQSYQGFPTEERAILMLCGNSENKKSSELDKDQCLYLEGTLNGMRQVLERHYHQPNETLTGKYLATIQKEFLPKEEIQGSIGNTAEMADFRNKNIFFGIEPHHGTTDIGYQEWKEQCEKWNKYNINELHNIFMTEDEIDQIPAIRGLYYSDSTLAVLVYNKKEKHQLQKAADCFFQMCDKDMKEAKNTNEKLFIIARTVSWLAKGQLLNDANSRTIGYGILPKLLLKYNLEPTIIQDPQIFKTRSICEIRESIRYGQQRFEAYKNKNAKLLEEDTFQEDFYGTEFYKEIIKREKFFEKKNLILQQTINAAYKSIKIYKALEETMKNIDLITKEQLNGSLKVYYTIALNIGEHIKNFFNSSKCSNESRMYYLYHINSEIGEIYGEFDRLKSEDFLFGNICRIYERIQKATKEATKKTTQSTHLTVPTYDTRSNNSSISENSYSEEITSITSDTSNISNNLSTGSVDSQIIDISKLE